MNPDTVLWIVFSVFVVGALAVDLGFFQRKAHAVGAREALVWSVVWVALALAFNGGVWWLKGGLAAKEFFAGYLIEKSLSVDNLFVFLVVFSYFAVPKQYEARILLWGILGAIVLRAVFVVVGAALLSRFAWMFYVFGGLLIVSGIKMLLKHEESDPGKNPVVRLVRKLFRVSDHLDGQRFFTRIDGKLAATPLFIVLCVVETTDVVFAVDSIPAIFAITKDPFIVFTSNIFAILGLRSLYFLLAQVMGLFRFLKYGLVGILWFVGLKMILHGKVKIAIEWSLATIGAILAISIILSLLFPAKPKEEPTAPAPPPPAP
jgi:tellurite resistance protein TerC